jgi:hypothetical protein
MVAVVALIGLVVAISFPAIGSGIESVRLNSATDAVVSFLNAGLNRADRRQQLVEIVISLEQNRLEMLSTDPGFTRSLTLPEGIRIVRIFPELPGAVEKARSIVLYPGGSVPRFGVELVNVRGKRRLVRVDPTTGVPIIENPDQNSEEEQ